MTVFVTEYAGQAYIRSGSVQNPAPAAPFVALTQISSGGSTAALTTIALSSATRLVSIVSLGVNAFFNIGGSSTAAAPTSTQMDVAPAGVPIVRGVNPKASLFAFSS